MTPLIIFLFTVNPSSYVIPAQAGIQKPLSWITPPGEYHHFELALGHHCCYQNKYHLLSNTHLLYSGQSVPTHAPELLPLSANFPEFAPKPRSERVFPTAALPAQAVGTKWPNGFGIYDLHGNAWEWCEDRLHKRYIGAPSDGSAWIHGGSPEHIVRGGSIVSEAELCRSANRSWRHPQKAHGYTGFRAAFALAAGPDGEGLRRLREGVIGGD